MSKEALTEDYVRDVARSAQAVKVGDADAVAIAQAVGPFNRIVRDAALELPFEAEPANHLLALAPERRP